MRLLLKILIILTVNGFSLLSSQTLQFSRAFAVVPKNLPLVLLNNHPDYFHVLRYNRLAHDFTLERRAKPSAEIIHFTSLKLNSVNADWFNYSNLDYLLFEYSGKIYFVFEKVLPYQKTLFLKVIDSLGRAGDFIEITHLDKDKTMLDFDLKFKRSSNNTILIVSTCKYYNYSIKKTVSLFDLEQKNILWNTALPLENSFTGYTNLFTSNASNDLYYITIKSQIVAFRRKYIDHMQKSIPALLYDSLILNHFSNATHLINTKAIDAHHFTQLNGITLSLQQGEPLVQLQFSKKTDESRKTQSEFLAQKFSGDLSEVLYSNTSFLNSTIEEKLNFYDGTDFSSAADKDYDLLDTFCLNNSSYTVLERKDKNFYKEMVVWESDLSSGKIVHQYLVPRKILASEAFSRYGKIGEASFQVFKDKLTVYLLESKVNAREDPDDFNYYRFQQESKIKKCNLVLYQLQSDGLIEKKVLHDNAYFEFIPIKSLSDQKIQPLLYFNNGTQEKFATLSLNP